MNLANLDLNRSLFELDKADCAESLDIFYVYEHWRPDKGTCFYVGKGHKNRAYTPHSRNRHWRNIVKKLRAAGLDFDVRIVFSGLTEEESLAKEQEHIKWWRERAELANISNGGEGTTGYRASEETRALISQKGKGRKATPETRAKLSRARLGNKYTLGRKLSDEHKEKIGAKVRGELNPNYGRVFGDDVRERMRQGQLGKKRDPEAVAKIAAKNTGKKRSEETRRRLSEAAKAQWDRYRAKKAANGVG